MSDLNIHIIDAAAKEIKVESGFDSLLDFEIKYGLLAEVVKAELANARTSNAHTKTRAEVRGGGKKPWKQKGTGRARHGSIRSPIWIGGGITFGPRNDTNWSQKINKSARVSALKSIIKDRLLVDALYQFAPKVDFGTTKVAASFLDSITTSLKTTPKQIVILYTSKDKEMTRGFVNTNVTLLNAFNLKIHKIANTKAVVMTQLAREMLETKLQKARRKILTVA